MANGQATSQCGAAVALPSIKACKAMAIGQQNARRQHFCSGIDQYLFAFTTAQTAKLVLLSARPSEPRRQPDWQLRHARTVPVDVRQTRSAG
eukprot:6178649-Pleurochrysis_carterae.AAC.1